MLGANNAHGAGYMDSLILNDGVQSAQTQSSCEDENHDDIQEETDEKILKHYHRLLKMIGWKPMFEGDVLPNNWRNVVYLACVVCLILTGYFLQYQTCFRRDNPGAVPHYWPPSSENKTFSSFNNTNNTKTICHGSHVWPQFIIPDGLHCIVFVYCFLVLRVQKSDKIPNLIDKIQSWWSYDSGRLVPVFVMHSTTRDGDSYLSRESCKKKLRGLFALTVTWVTFSTACTIVHLYTQYKYMNFEVLGIHQFSGRAVVLFFLVISFLVTDFTYAAVVMNYCIQCLLLIFCLRGLNQEIQNGTIQFSKIKPEVKTCRDFLSSLNFHPGVVTSIILLMFGVLAASGLISLFDNRLHSEIRKFAIAASLVCWLIIMAMPLVLGGRVSSACSSLSHLGHDINYGHTHYGNNIPQIEKDSLLLYLSTLHFKAKICLIEVRLPTMLIICALALSVTLLLYQTDLIQILS